MARSFTRAPARLFVLLLLLSLAGGFSTSVATGAESEAEVDVPEMEGSALVEVNLPSRDHVDALNDEGWDIAEYLREEGDGTVTVQIDAERDDFVELAKRGYKIQTVIADDRTWRERLAEREAAIEAENRAKALVEGEISAAAVTRSAALEEGVSTFAIEPEVTIQRVDYFENYAGRFVSVEAFTPNGLPGNAGPTLALAWDSGPGTPFGNPVIMGKFTDGDPTPDVYMYHRHLVRIGGVGSTTPTTPSKVRVASSVGGVSEAPVKVWLDTDVMPFPPGFQNHFFNHYMDPTEIQTALDATAAEFSNLVDVVNVPNLTPGYQRQAQGTFAPLAPTLSVAAAAGSAGVRLSSTTGVAVGTVITIEPGPSQDVRTVTSVVTPNPPSPAPNVLFSTPTANAHASGVAVFHGEQALGSSAATAAQGSAVVLRTVAMGHQGGEQTRAEFRNPGAPNSALSVSIVGGNPLGGNDLIVNLATDGTGALSSTAAQVVAAINAGAGSLIQAGLWATNAGAGIVQPRSLVALDDFLNAPAYVQRGPFQSHVYRIRNEASPGPKTGILLFCQQHAREWVTPLTCYETAERLVRNYATDAQTKELVDNLDIFIYPSLNPDGSHHSLYDFQSQRKNMVNYCAPTSTSSMPSGRNGWGVDLNRNESVGTLFDGYGGASTSCTSEVFAGPAEQSEPETQNLNWVQDTFPNIKFSNNIHSSGGYFMWSPGAYINAGRITLPAPNIGIESYFFEAGDMVLQRIKEYRGTVITPQRTGPIADVLYSAAGNSADDAWYRRGSIAYSFEVGADRFNVTNRQPFVEPAVAGATGIRLVSTASLSVGDSIIIAPGTATEESNVVAQIPSPAPATGPNVILAKPLLYAQAAGTAVQEQTFSGVGFFPAYESEGRHEAMEFANGNYGLLESALLYSRDDEAPTSTTQVCTRPANEILCNDDTFESSPNPIDVTFRFQNEPSVIRYTLDGSTPNMGSRTWEAQAPRQPGEILNFTEPTLVKWFGTDIKGNVGDVREALFVVGTFDNNSGILEPVSGGGTAKAGSTLPLKFSLGGYYSLAVLVGTPTSQQVDCATGTPIGSSSPLGTPGATQFTFNSATGEYQYNWKSEKSWAGTCRKLTLTLADNTTLTATINFTR